MGSLKGTAGGLRPRRTGLGRQFLLGGTVVRTSWCDRRSLNCCTSSFSLCVRTSRSSFWDRVWVPWCEHPKLNRQFTQSCWCAHQATLRQLRNAQDCASCNCPIRSPRALQGRLSSSPCLPAPTRENSPAQEIPLTQTEQEQ